MILTRSIRRKLVIGLALVFAMLLLLSVAGLSAIYGYWSLIGDIRFARHQEPRHAELSAAMAGLLEPFLHVRKRKVDPFEERTERNGTSPDEIVDIIDQIKISLFFNEPLWNERRQKARSPERVLSAECGIVEERQENVDRFDIAESGSDQIAIISPRCARRPPPYSSRS